MRVLICGSRDFTDEHIIDIVVSGLVADRWSLTLIHGAARGADTLAAESAKIDQDDGHNVTIVAFPADWEQYGRGAGPIRNQQMLDEGEPNMVIAFVNKPLVESRGTADMVRRAQRAGLPVYVVTAL